METPVNLLPGPTQMAAPVRAAFAAESISHRSAQFQEDMCQLKRSLCELVGARKVEILLGSGTLANDVIAGQLSLLDGHGVILSSGEFGERLEDHASRWGLAFVPLVKLWGEGFEAGEIRDALAQHDSSWLWAVHCETSTGVLTDIEMLQGICTQNGIKLCLDCISSIGTVPCDLSAVWLASGVSGKGLRGLPGLAFVFYNHEVEVAPTLPRYLDLGFYAARDGVPFSHSSNLIRALAAAVQTRVVSRSYEETAAWRRGCVRS